MRTLVVLAALAVVTGGTWLQLAEVAARRQAVWTEPVVRRDLVRRVSLRGVVVPDGSITVSTPISGQVRTVHARVGDAVARGDRLVEFDPAPLQLGVERARAASMAQHSEVAGLAFEAAAASYRAGLHIIAGSRARQLVAAGLVSRESADATVTDASKANAETSASWHRLATGVAKAFRALAERDQALAVLALASVESPVDGLVTAVHVRAGQPAFEGAANVPATPLVTVARRTPLLEVPLAQRDVSWLNDDTGAEVAVDALPGRTWPGRVVALTAPGAATALIDMKSPPSALRIGMSATATLTLATQPNVLAVPTHALRSPPGSGPANHTRANRRTRSDTDRRPGGPAQETAWVIRGGMVTRVAVTTGLRADGYTEVRSGLAEGDAVITGPYTLLRSVGVGDVVVPVRAPLRAEPQ